MRAIHTLLVCCLVLPACQTLMPTPDKPYDLAVATQPLPTGSHWTWVDARKGVSPVTATAPGGLIFGDTVMRPRPFEAIQTEFIRAVTAHPSSAEIVEKLRNRTLRLQGFEASVGLWARLSDRQQNNWEFVRVSMSVDVDGNTYEALDVHRFNNSDQPSPVSIPLRKAVENLVQQILLF